jgi:hypothetical protein
MDKHEKAMSRRDFIDTAALFGLTALEGSLLPLLLKSSSHTHSLRETFLANYSHETRIGVGGIELVTNPDQNITCSQKVTASDETNYIPICSGYSDVTAMYHDKPLPISIDESGTDGADMVVIDKPQDASPGDEVTVSLTYQHDDVMLRDKPFPQFFGIGQKIDKPELHPDAPKIKYESSGEYYQILDTDSLDQVISSYDKLESIVEEPDKELSDQASQLLGFIDRVQGRNLNQVVLELRLHFYLSGINNGNLPYGYVYRPENQSTMPDHYTFKHGGDCDDHCVLFCSIINKLSLPNVVSAKMTHARNDLGAHAYVTVQVIDDHGDTKYITFDPLADSYGLNIDDQFVPSLHETAQDKIVERYLREHGL